MQMKKTYHTGKDFYIILQCWQECGENEQTHTLMVNWPMSIKTLMRMRSDPGPYPAEYSHYVYKKTRSKRLNIDRSVEKWAHSCTTSGNANQYYIYKEKFRNMH